MKEQYPDPDSMPDNSHSPVESSERERRCARCGAALIESARVVEVPPQVRTAKPRKSRVDSELEYLLHGQTNPDVRKAIINSYSRRKERERRRLAALSALAESISG